MKWCWYIRQSLVLVALLGCSTSRNANTMAAINAHLGALPKIPVLEPCSDTNPCSNGLTCNANICQKATEEMRMAGGANLVCVRTEYNELNSPHEVVSFSANSNIWPGMILNGNSVELGTFEENSMIERAPITFSTSLTNIEGSAAVTLPAPTSASYRNAHLAIVQSARGAPAARDLALTMEGFTSSEQLSGKIGLSVAWASSQRVSGLYSFSQNSSASRYFLMLSQSMYTEDVVPPRSPAALFAPGASAVAVETAFPDRQPVYVSSISFGRRLVLAFESADTSRTSQAQLDANVNAWSTTLSLTSALSTAISMGTVSVKAIFVGGSPEAEALAGASITSVAQLNEVRQAFVRDGLAENSTLSAQPIAYSLRYVSDNSLARLSFTSRYAVESCTVTTDRYRIRVRKMGATGEDRDQRIYGTIRASFGRFDQRCSPNWPLAGSYPCQQSVAVFARGSGTAVDVTPDISSDNGGLGQAFVNLPLSQDNPITIVPNLAEQDGGGDDRLGATALRVETTGCYSFLATDGSETTATVWVEVAPCSGSQCTAVPNCPPSQ